MPGYLLTSGDVMLCAHGAKASATGEAAKVTLGGQKALLQPMPATVAGCSNPAPPVNVGPCVSATFATGTTRVTSMGMPLLLQDSQAVCTPTGTPLTIAPTQLRVKAK